MTVQELVGERRDVRERGELLVREFHPALSAGTVLTVVAACREELVHAGVRAGLATAVEAMARARLRARVDGTAPRGRS